MTQVATALVGGVATGSKREKEGCAKHGGGQGGDKGFDSGTDDVGELGVD